MKKSFCSFLLAISLSSGLYAQTDDYVILDKRADDFDHWQERIDYTYGTTVISKETKVPVVVLEQQRTQTHLGYGGLMIANALAAETGKSFDEIAALKRSDYGWGRIARENKVDLGRIVSRLDRVEGEFRQGESKAISGEAASQSKDGKSAHTGDKHSRGSRESKVKAKTTKTKASAKPKKSASPRRGESR